MKVSEYRLQKEFMTCFLNLKKEGKYIIPIGDGGIRHLLFLIDCVRSTFFESTHFECSKMAALKCIKDVDDNVVVLVRCAL